MKAVESDAPAAAPMGEDGAAGRPALAVSYAVRTHTGLVRDHNEDDFLVMPHRGLYLVADGMGGHAAGKVASGECIRTIEDFFDGAIADDLPDQPEEQERHLSPPAAELARALRVANRRIFDASSRDRELAGMGTTAVGIRVAEGRVAIAHAGDSRCYLLRGNTLTQLTVDHSLSNFLLALGREVEAQMAEATMSNVIMRALGLEPDVVVDAQEILAEPGDRYILCSDGLSDLVDDSLIEESLSTIASRDEAAEALVQAALDNGGRDNITVLIVEIARDASAPAALRTPANGDTLPMTPVQIAAPPTVVKGDGVGVRGREQLYAAATTEVSAIMPEETDPRASLSARDTGELDPALAATIDEDAASVEDTTQDLRDLAEHAARASKNDAGDTESDE